MDSIAVLRDGFARVQAGVYDALDGIPAEHLNARLDSASNPIGWLIWHLTRVQDDHIADASGLEQVWLADGWQTAFGLKLPALDTGFGHTAEEVAAVRVEAPDTLADYYDATHQQTLRYLDDLEPEVLDEVIDTSWQPPVTLGVRLVSVLAEDLQHVGQAAYLRGVLSRQS